VHAPPPFFAGLFLLSMATVLHEVALTRLFSVTMWYHFAFMAISVTMFGMTAGALAVYAAPGRYPDDSVRWRAGAASAAFGLAAVASMLAHLRIPVALDLTAHGLSGIALTLVLITVPFYFSGVAITLALTRFPAQVGALYAADLGGAAVACLVVGRLIDLVGPPGTILAVGGTGALAAYAFLPVDARRARRAAAATALAFGALVVADGILLARGVNPLPVLWVKGKPADPPLYERWNALSRVSVHGDPSKPQLPTGWGLSPRRPAVPLEKLRLLIDATAATDMLKTNMDPARLEHLKYDVTALAHHLRRDAKVAVVGAGGGRDVLTALAFGPARVTAIELNPDIVDLVRGPYAEFTGRFAHHPKVNLVVDEARSFLARHHELHDILQVSLIDTWAATGAGAYVLSENTLYTAEAWSLFLDRLTERGLLSFTRFYDKVPVEVFRMLALAGQTLRARGVADPRAHVAVVRCAEFATLLVGRQPLTDSDVRTLEEVARRMEFDVELSPRTARVPALAAVLASADPARDFADSPFDVSAPTDDRPYFFQALKLASALDPKTWSAGGLWFNAAAVVTLIAVLCVVLLLGALVLAVPLVAKTTGQRPPLPLLLYFVGIGLAFMLVEVSQMQRLVVLLGHPTWSLSVVLGTLFVSGGLGSLLVGRRLASGVPPGALLVLVIVAVLTGLAVPAAVRLGEGWSTPGRVLLAALVVFPLGVLMGMPFPLGMHVAARMHPEAAPWLFGINGAASITASVLAVVIGIAWGISTAYWAGVLCYALTALCFARLARPDRAG
jgi:spermidine synthase